MKWRLFARLEIVTFVAIVLYAIFYAATPHIHLDLYIVPGLLLLFYLPGRWLTIIFPRLQRPWQAAGQFALSVFLSVSIIATLQLAFAGYAINPHSAVTLILVVNIIFLVVGVLLRRKSDNIRPMRLSRNDVLVLSIVLFVMIATIAINPLASDADGFLAALHGSLACNCAVVGFRQIFVMYMALTGRTLGLPYTVIFRVLFPTLFYISSWFLLDYAKRTIKSPSNVAVAYLLLLASPVILSEVNIIRPQVAMIAYTLPILVLAIEALVDRSWTWSIVGLWFSLLAIGFHELSVVLLLVTLIPVLSKIWAWGGKASGKKPWYILAAIIIAYPYAKIIYASHYFGRLVNITHTLAGSFHSVTWHWWFINSYVTIDGFNIGWPGIQTAYYYAYNGILVLLGLILVLIWLRRKGFRNNRMIIPGAYIAIFFVFAEVLPRLGFFFFPNRAWVDLMLGASLLAVMAIGGLEHKVRMRWVIVAMYALIVIGVIGSLYVAQNNVSEVFREEIGALHYIQSTPTNSLFLSSQDNHALVQLYGERNYATIIPGQKLSRSQFDLLIDKKLDAVTQPQVIEKSPEIKEEVKQYRDNVLISDTVTVTTPPVVHIDKPIYRTGSPLYFVYSLRKSSGQNAARAYNGLLIDLQNKDSYQNIGYHPVYDDGSVIILKLR